MEFNEVLIQLEKRNMVLRIISIVILIVIALSVLYFRFGYSDPDDSSLFNQMGDKVIDCKTALYYYSEKELGYKLQPPRDLSNITLNLSI